MKEIKQTTTAMLGKQGFRFKHFYFRSSVVTMKNGLNESNMISFFKTAFIFLVL